MYFVRSSGFRAKKLCRQRHRYLAFGLALLALKAKGDIDIGIRIPYFRLKETAVL
jgi:hypothetical protein